MNSKKLVGERLAISLADGVKCELCGGCAIVRHNRVHIEHEKSCPRVAIKARSV